MKQMTFELIGVTPLMMHNGRLANPFDEITRQIKEITSKRKKSDSDQEQLFRLEFEGSLYCDSQIGPYVPSENIESFINDGARLKRRGKDTERAVRVAGDKNKLIYKGPRTPEELFGKRSEFVDVRMIVNPSTGGRSMRCRPIFREWSVVFEVLYREEMIDTDDLKGWVEDSGKYNGLLEMRPRMGQCTAKVIDD
jgi:hypothetical protein